MQPNRRVSIIRLNPQHEPDNDMADNDNGEIGRGVVCALVVQLLPAERTKVVDLEIGAKHLPAAATRAESDKSSLDRLPGVSRLLSARQRWRGRRSGRHARILSEEGSAPVSD